MAAATSITVQETPFVAFTGSFTIDPGSIVTGAIETQTIAVPGAKVGDLVLIQPRTDIDIDLINQSAYVDAADSLTFVIYNISGGTLNMGSKTFDFAVFRGRNTNVASG